MKPKNRFQAFYLRQLAKGLRAVMVWVPSDKAEAIKSLALELRRESEQEKPKKEN